MGTGFRRSHRTTLAGLLLVGASLVALSVDRGLTRFGGCHGGSDHQLQLLSWSYFLGWNPRVGVDVLRVTGAWTPTLGGYARDKRFGHLGNQ